MGDINRFDLNRIMKDFKTPFFFETGTFRGDGVSYALRAPFSKVYSVEIIPQLAEAARLRFKEEPRAGIIGSDSITAFRNTLPGIPGNCVFWLDAHFPGADAGLTPYDEKMNELIRLPLPAEVETIRRERPGADDVLIIDDLRIYEDGPYENGPVPDDALPLGRRNVNFILDLFDSTHLVARSYRDEGYLLLFPKKTYRRRHFTFRNLFKKESPVTDLYFNEPPGKTGVAATIPASLQTP